MINRVFGGCCFGLKILSNIKNFGVRLINLGNYIKSCVKSFIINLIRAEIYFLSTTRTIGAMESGEAKRVLEWGKEGRPSQLEAE